MGGIKHSSHVTKALKTKQNNAIFSPDGLVNIDIQDNTKTENICTTRRLCLSEKTWNCPCHIKSTRWRRLNHACIKCVHEKLAYIECWKIYCWIEHSVVIIAKKVPLKSIGRLHPAHSRKWPNKVIISEPKQHRRTCFQPSDMWQTDIHLEENRQTRKDYFSVNLNLFWIELEQQIITSWLPDL